MTKIIPLIFPDNTTTMQMAELITSDFLQSRNIFEIADIPPFNLINKALPVNMKFGEETYAAVEGDETLGLISLAPDGQEKIRWKITRLDLNPNSYDIGKQLIDYAVNKYGGAGAEIFVTAVDETHTEAVSLFKSACLFRTSSRIHLHKLQALDIKTSEDYFLSDKIFREAKVEDAKKIANLNNEALYPQFRTYHSKTIKDFEPIIKNDLACTIMGRLKGCNNRNFVLDSTKHDSIEGFLSIIEIDKKSFRADVLLSLAYQDYCKEAVKYAIGVINKLSMGEDLFIAVRDYHQCGKKLKQTLIEHNFKPERTLEILVKDYWKPIEQSHEAKSPVIIFSDLTTPACNTID